VRGGCADDWWLQDVPEYTVVAGNPARVVRRLQLVEENAHREDPQAVLKRLEALEAEVRDIKGQLAAGAKQGASVK